MTTADAETPTVSPLLGMFIETCRALEAPAGQPRLTAFLRLPDELQDRVWREVAQSVDGGSVPEDARR